MKNTGILWLLFALALWSSCRSDFETVTFTGNVEFSKDTVYLDTIFSNISSSTYTLKVYNRGNEDLTIPRIELRRGEESRYRLNVDGLPGKSFDNIDILAKDSIYIFIETTIDFEEVTATENQILYVDAIDFISEFHSQTVPLVTLVKDAVFLYPKQGSDGTFETIPLPEPGSSGETRVRGFYLDNSELEFTAEKPYVIYGYAAVPPGKTLNIQPGSRIHFHAESGILVPEGASIRSAGGFSEDRELLEKEVIFEGDRLEPQFENIPGQWGTIWLAKGSKGNVFQHTTIRNGNIGLLVDSSSPLLLKNLQIYNSISGGLVARNATIDGENLVINNSGQSSLHLSGGDYKFRHSTFSNYWQAGFRQNAAVFISNRGNSSADLLAKFSNCIIYGNQGTELQYYVNEGAAFKVQIENSLIRFSSRGSADDPLYDFNNVEYYKEILLNEDPLFEAPQKNNLRLKEESPARDRGKMSTALQVPLDLLQTNRTVTPDLGAYEWKSPPEEEDQEN